MRGSRLSPGLRRSFILVVLLGLLGGCASQQSDDLQSRSGGFYGGVSGGMSRP